MVVTKKYDSNSKMDMVCKSLTKELETYLTKKGETNLDFINLKDNENVYDIDLINDNYKVEVQGTYSYNQKYNMIYMRKLKWAKNGKHKNHTLVHYEIAKDFSIINIYKMNNMVEMLDCKFRYIGYDKRNKKYLNYPYILIPKKEISTKEIRRLVLEGEEIYENLYFDIYDENLKEVDMKKFADFILERPYDLEIAMNINENLSHFEKYELEKIVDNNEDDLYTLKRPTKNGKYWKDLIKKQGITDALDELL